jgi:importin-5
LPLSERRLYPVLASCHAACIGCCEPEARIDVLGAWDYDGNGADDEEGYETIKIGDKRIGIRTSALEDRATAFTMLSCFLAELRGEFLPYVEQVTHLMVPRLKFFYNDECRTAAANCMPDLVHCLIESGNVDQLGSLVAFIMPNIVRAINNKPDVEVLVSMVDQYVRSRILYP